MNAPDYATGRNMAEAVDKSLALTIKAAAHKLGVGVSTLYGLLGGELETITIGRRRLVLYSSIKSYVERCRIAQGGYQPQTVPWRSENERQAAEAARKAEEERQAAETARKAEAERQATKKKRKPDVEPRTAMYQAAKPKMFAWLDEEGAPDYEKRDGQLAEMERYLEGLLTREKNPPSDTTLYRWCRAYIKAHAARQLSRKVHKVHN